MSCLHFFWKSLPRPASSTRPAFDSTFLLTDRFAVSRTNDHVDKTQFIINSWVQQYALDNTVCGGNIGDWDISNVQELSSTFANLPNFNADLSGWNVRNIVKMDQTFMDAVAFNGNIENWNVARVTDMSSMFSGAEAFNIDISGWDMSSVTSIVAMLNGAEAFDRDITEWQLSSVASGGFTSSIGGLSRKRNSLTPGTGPINSFEMRTDLQHLQIHHSMRLYVMQPRNLEILSPVTIRAD